MTLIMTRSYLTQTEQQPDQINQHLTRNIQHAFYSASELCLQNYNKLRQLKKILTSKYQPTSYMNKELEEWKDKSYRFDILAHNCLVPKDVLLTDATKLQPQQIYIAAILSLSHPINKDELQYALRASSLYCIKHGKYRCIKYCGTKINKFSKN